MPVYKYDTPAALAAACEAAGGATRGGGGSWTDGETFAQSAQYARTGNTALVPDAERLLDQIMARAEVDMPRWAPDVMGAYPMVPEALAGAPDCMRRKVHELSDRAPVRIFADVSSSASVDGPYLRRRGIAILALVMLLARTRPVDLYIFGTFHASERYPATRDDGLDRGAFFAVTRVETAPLDLARAAYVLTSAGWDRNLGHALAERLGGFNGNWAWSKSYTEFMDADSKTNRDVVRCVGGDPDRDLLIPAAVHQDPLLADPVRWVNERAAAFFPKED